MNAKITVLSLGLLFSLVGVGCTSVAPEEALTFRYRASKTESFAQLTSDQKSRLAQGKVEFGDSPDMVYLALGKPDNVEKTAKGERWDYYSRPRDPDGFFQGGDRPPVFGFTPTPVLLHSVAFRDGKVGGIVERQRASIRKATD